MHDHPHDHHHDHDHHHGHGHAHGSDAGLCHPRGPGGPDHVFLGADHDRNARRTWLVIGITATMMVIEIAAGAVFGSMALLADGWHMATHAAALSIAAVSYMVARRHAHDPRFTFGTGKLGDLAAFGSAVVLGVVALLIGWESLMRLVDPVGIHFGEAIAVAVIGLAVNVGSAVLLHQGPHDHGHGHSHDHGHGHAHEVDHNLRAAYLHVLADALTSVLAIVALVAGRAFGWVWLDPIIGMLGAILIARWSYGMMRDAGGVLVDFVPSSETLPERIRAAIETDGARVVDLHVWQLGPGHRAAIVAIADDAPRPASDYRKRLAHLPRLSHVTIEVETA
ncbi:CDF family Co(II)/Ni(II) efflux transporter DmeF [Rhodovulum visakhapatnamense]|uniref:CDF family Co(II)/Ni(II) efflux transporter DmeF n=1 Tax=Rhodovulum visakhapatnamense TaxID=364297 RepID=A0ABS1RCP9_9RHOB|nr:CDF family Co(II)/Ni(II) efflux transporter DmeF [Rhodovulum visakhapatnamense]MBL3569945.1 CDF family Co(II)/Ni(II) efflux transporter DmeF [Rhodovulum visakhapatnamense]MBL3577417.1 CDF family Co(II)/Ni(II) efflux transporter DmeF [Rhodovulum visakhapatnamense]